jgi:hypothetical protein
MYSIAEIIVQVEVAMAENCELPGTLIDAPRKQLNLVGDPNQPGPSTLRLKFAKGPQIVPPSRVR